jgi:hypothetical protein
MRRRIGRMKKSGQCTLRVANATLEFCLAETLVPEQSASPADDEIHPVRCALKRGPRSRGQCCMPAILLAN